VLQTDKSHLVVVKRAGYIPELVVVETELRNDEHFLSPSRITVRLRRSWMGRRDVIITQAPEIKENEHRSTAAPK
jgi:hypothetical protein